MEKNSINNSSSKNTYDYLFKILIIGDSGAGKSCLMLRYTRDDYRDNHMTTIGVDFQTRFIQIKNEIIKLLLWDTAGQEKFRSITEAYYRGSHGVLIVYDITDLKSFKNIKRWLSDIQSHALEDVQILLVGNKCDLIENRQVSYEQGKKLADDVGINFIETSAKTSMNVEEAFMMISTQIRASNKFKKNTSSGDMISLSNQHVQQSRSYFYWC
jgi:Ras-related protein Rab-1A